MRRDCYLRFVAWNPHAHRFEAIPAGAEVALLDDRTVREDLVLAEAVTDDSGAVHLTFDTDDAPDLYVRVRVPDGTPRHIGFHTDSNRGVWSRKSPTTTAIPREWTSVDRTALERPGRLGAWEDLSRKRIGRPDHPVVFELTHPRPRIWNGNRAHALIDGPDTLRRLEALLAAAKHTIHVQMMLWFDDSAGRRIVTRLVEAAERGVTVRVLIDRHTTEDTHVLTSLHGTWLKWFRTVEEPRHSELLAQVEEDVEADQARGDLSRLLRRMRRAENLDLRVTSFPKVFIRTDVDGPLPAAYDAISDARPWFNVARVDHRKMVVCDGRVALLGGMNIGQEYL
jgi:hypothetical protein